jgi:transcriptional regulator with XRE-family HTH domain
LAPTLRETRLRKGLSVEQLSKRSGVRGWAIQQIEDGSPSYVPSEGNTALLAEALKLPVGSLLAERDRLVELLHHRPYEAAKESRGVST